MRYNFASSGLSRADSPVCHSRRHADRVFRQRPKPDILTELWADRISFVFAVLLLWSNNSAGDGALANGDPQARRAFENVAIYVVPIVSLVTCLVWSLPFDKCLQVRASLVFNQ